VRSEVIEALLDWKLPGGEPVVARARRREEVYRGPLVARAPDVVLELGAEGGYALTLVPTRWDGGHALPLRRLAQGELAGGRGRGTNGTHRRDGVWIAAPALPALDLGAAPVLERVAPALLAAMGAPPEGEVAAAPAERGRAPGAGGRETPPEPRARLVYTPAEEAAVRERLRALGYLE
jgi:hypothetical protein